MHSNHQQHRAGEVVEHCIQRRSSFTTEVLKKPSRIVLMALFVLVTWITLSPAASGVIKAMSALGIRYSEDHFYAYFALAVLVGLTEPARRAAWIGIVLILLSFCLEFLQIMSPGRAFEVSDLEYNAIGVVVGLLPASLTRAAALRIGSRNS